MSGTHMSNVIAELRSFDSATVSNAVEHFAARDPTTGFANNELRCLTPEVAAPMVGYAVTATADSTTPGDRRTSRVDDVVSLIHEAPKPVVLVVKHVGHDRTRCCLFGDMFCTVLSRLGGVGIVTDANIRDRAAIRERTPDLHVFASGLVVSHGYPAYLEFGVTVSFCGMTFAPGDLLHGDESGLVSIPSGLAAATVKRAREVQAEEAEYFDFLASDRFSLEELRRRIIPHE